MLFQTGFLIKNQYKMANSVDSDEMAVKMSHIGLEGGKD